MRWKAIRRRTRIAAPRQAGFSLLELLVAIGVFLVISAASFMLFSRHQALLSREQGLTGLSLSMRNILTQMQLDLINAGAGMVTGVNVPNAPVGATIVNSVIASGSSCRNSTTGAYTSTCFDRLNVIAIDPNTPPLPPQTNAGACASTSGATSVYVPAASGLTLAQTAALFHTGDQVLLINGAGSQFTSTVLTANGAVSGTYVQLQHNATGVGAVLGANTAANDPLALTTDAAMGTPPLGNSFCPATDWLMKLSPITYFVDASDSANPQLKRTRSGATDVVMDQVIGFKVGATIWNGSASTGISSATYDYNNADYASNYTLLRSIRVAVIARTRPSTDPSYTFVNPFDGGRYQVLGASIVVNPRNMSMNDN